MEHRKSINQRIEQSNQPLHHEQSHSSDSSQRRSSSGNSKGNSIHNCRFQALFFSLLRLLVLTVAANFYVASTLPALISTRQLTPNVHKKDDSSGMLHIVTTRFMQAQPQLFDLGMARLLLFETFCLPTMIHQDVEKESFLWFVMTDPNLDAVLLDRLKRLLAPYPNFYLVASNAKLLTPHNLTAGMKYASTIILTGDLQMLYHRMFDVNRPLLIETRLDSDDGLESSALQEIQSIVPAVSSSSAQEVHLPCHKKARHAYY